MAIVDKKNIAALGLWKTFFIFTGISTLFVWNSVLSLTSYWSTKIAPGVQNYMGFPFMLGSFVCFFFFSSINSRISYIKQIILWPTLMTMIFFVYLAIGELIEDTTVKMTIFLIGCFIQGFLNNLVQMSQARFCMAWGEDEVRWYMGGTGIAGIGASLLNFVLTYIPLGVTVQFIIF